jgi:Tetratricopeptide repeat
MSLTAERGQVNRKAQRRRVCALADAAEVQCRRASYGKAESLLRQALAIARKVLGRKDLVVATLLNNLAVVHRPRLPRCCWRYPRTYRPTLYGPARAGHDHHARRRQDLGR